MRRERPLLICCLLAAAVPGAAGTRSTPGGRPTAPATKRRTPAPKKPGPTPGVVRLPPNSPPAISIQGRGREYRAAAAELAGFISDLHRGRRARAADRLSSRFTEGDRRDLIEKRWLRKDEKRYGDFNQILYLRDIQIRPQEQIQGDRLRLAVMPRDIPFGLPRSLRARYLVGRLVVPMLREKGRWRVDIRRS